MTSIAGLKWRGGGVFYSVHDDTPHIIDLVAGGTWVACCLETAAQATAFASAANRWVEANPFRLFECPFEEHIPMKAFSVNFEAAPYDDRWGCYCDCAWVLEHHLGTVVEATRAAEKYFDHDGVSSLFLEWIIFEQEDEVEELPDGRPLYIFDPELRIYDVGNGQNIDEYLLSGGYGAIVAEKIDSQSGYVDPGRRFQ